MSSPHRPRSSASLLLFVPMIVPALAVLAAIPWLNEQPDWLALLLVGIAGTLTVLASVALAVVQDRQIDEWQRTNARFATQWGWTVGSGLFALLLILPPVQDLILSGAAIWGGSPDPDKRLALTTFTFGFMAVVIAQALCIAVISLGWHVWMSRAPRDRS